MSKRAACRSWLENTLLALERQGLLDVTRERWPPHYHAALFPVSYMAHVERLAAAEQARADSIAATEAANQPAPQPVVTLAAAPVTPATRNDAGVPAWFLTAVPLPALAAAMARRPVRRALPGRALPNAILLGAPSDHGLTRRTLRRPRRCRARDDSSTVGTTRKVHGSSRVTP